MTLLYSETAHYVRRLLPVWWQRWLSIVALWTVVALLSAAHWHLLLSDRDPWVDWELVRVKLQVWYIWAALTPIILWLGYRFRLEGPRWAFHAIALVATSLVVTTAYIYIYTGILYANMSLPNAGRFDNLLHFTLQVHSTYYYLAFWVIIGIEQLLISYRRWHEREILASQLQMQLAQAQLQAVKSQLQPHFLFNMLNTISSTILEGEREKAYHLTAKLGELLRMVLDRGEQDFVTLQAEMALNEKYLELMSARFENRLRVETQLAPESLSALVPDFVLQPLVENAITHGVSCTTGVSTITIRSLVSGNRLVLEVEDRGEPQSRRLIETSGGGRGHRLTEERLRRLYGGEYRFVATRHETSGMLVHIEIPLTLASSEKAG